MVLNYDIKISFTDEELPEDEEFLDPEGMAPEDDHSSFRFPDGTFHFLDESTGHMFAKILEHNTEFLDDNFDIEVYKINEDEELEKLYFMNKGQSNIKDGILLDESPNAEILDFGPQYVEYYFDLLADHEINNEIYCSAASKETLEDIYSDKELFNCDEIEKTRVFSDIYKISKEADEEPC